MITNNTQKEGFTTLPWRNPCIREVSMIKNEVSGKSFQENMVSFILSESGSINGQSQKEFNTNVMRIDDGADRLDVPMVEADKRIINSDAASINYYISNGWLCCKTARATGKWTPTRSKKIDINE